MQSQSDCRNTPRYQNWASGEEKVELLRFLGSEECFVFEKGDCVAHLKRASSFKIAIATAMGELYSASEAEPR